MSQCTSIGRFRVNGRGVNVRAAPRRTGRPLGKLNDGTLLIGYEERADWLRIEFRPPLSTDVLEGWVYRPYLARVLERETGQQE